jgi:hypothetical protein
MSCLCGDPGRTASADRGLREERAILMTATSTAHAHDCTTLEQTLARYWDMEGVWSPDDEQSFQRRFDDAPVGVFRVWPEGTIHDCNEHAAEMLR